MGKLLKYELRKSLFSKGIIVALTLVLELAFLIGCAIRSEETFTITASLLFVLGVTSITLMGILSVIMLHQDMNTKQGYMLLMTPNSCFKILGAKVLECGISLMLAGAFFFILGLIDVNLLLSMYNRSIIDLFLSLMQSINEDLTFTVQNAAALLFSLISGWLRIITCAYLADVISSSLLKGKKANLVVSFILFVLINILLNRIVSLIPGSNFTQINLFLVQGVFSLFFSIVMYIITAVLMENHLSV